MTDFPCISAKFTGNKDKIPVAIEFCVIPSPDHPEDYSEPIMTSGLFQIIIQYKNENGYTRWTRLFGNEPVDKTINNQCYIVDKIPSNSPSDTGLKYYLLMNNSAMACQES